MHYYFWERGVDHEETIFENFLKAQWYRWKRIAHVDYCRCKKCAHEWMYAVSLEKAIACPKCESLDYEGFKKEQEIEHVVQGALRQIKLFEYVFPEESLDEFLVAINAGVDADSPVPIRAANMAMRKFLGCEPVPKPKSGTVQQRIIPRLTSIIPIGIKRDKRKKWEEQGVTQEML